MTKPPIARVEGEMCRGRELERGQHKEQQREERSIYASGNNIARGRPERALSSLAHWEDK
jgi:hypothetical protein